VDKVEELLRAWDHQCQENRIDERGREEIFVSVLDQICQAGNKRFHHRAAMCGTYALGTLTVAGTNVIPFMLVYAPILMALGTAATAWLESLTVHPLMVGNGSLLGGAVTRLCLDPALNLLASLLLGFAVEVTDYVEFGEGPFSGSGFERVGSVLDMDYVNVVLAGVQGGMVDFGLGYVSGDTVADLMKPFLGVVGLRLHPLVALGFEVAGLVSMLPQMDQFYKECVWPVAKLALGASLMGGVGHVIQSALLNTVAVNAISAAENVFVNHALGNPLFQDVTFDFSAFTEYIPGTDWAGYDYASNYLTHYVWGMW